MRVRLVATADLTVVGLVARVNVRVLLAVRAVREASVAAVVLAFERFLACNEKQRDMKRALL